MKKKIKHFSESLQRLIKAIEFRILMVLLSTAVFIYPLAHYFDLQQSLSVYTSVFLSWIGLILVLFILSFQKNDEDEE